MTSHFDPRKSTDLFDSADVNGLMLMDEMARVISEYSKVSQEVESVEQDIKIEIDQEPTETKVTTGKLLHCSFQLLIGKVRENP